MAQDAAPDAFRARVEAALVARGLGRDAIGIVGNAIEHDYQTPRAAPPLMMELLADPLRAVDAAAIFARSVPSDVVAFAAAAPGDSTASLDSLLERYIGELAAAQAELMAAVGPFDEGEAVRGLMHGFPVALLPAIEQAVDVARLARARALFLDATARFARDVRSPAVRFPAQPQRFDSAIGPVVIGSAGPDRHAAGAALIVDPGGDDVYERAPVTGGAISVIIDLGGNDRYSGPDIAVHALSALVDVSGNDVYVSAGPAFGAAVAGVSVLLDLDGDDDYQAHIFGEGAALFGFGALIDRRGNDRYRVSTFGQGYGGAGGVGLLWDQAGDDRYTATGEPDPFQRGGALSFAQGAASGLRPALAGGIGILRDDAGDDEYRMEMFGQGTGYYYGLGMLWDGGGNDQYFAVRYAQGNGVHQAVGLLRDEAGDDRYELSFGVGQGMGYDVAVGVLVDRSGNDRYRSRYIAQGSGSLNGLGLLADEAGDNTWEIADWRAWGHAQWSRRLPSVGVFLYQPTHARLLREGKPATPLAARVEFEEEAALDCGAQPRELLQRMLADPAAGIAEHADLLTCVLGIATPAQAERVWPVLERQLTAPRAPYLWPIAEALISHPGPPPLMQQLKTVLRDHPRCPQRALWMVTWASAEEARAALGASCWRLQAAARERLKALGVAVRPAASTADFLRAN